MLTPEQQARQTIDQLLDAAGWQVQDYARLDLGAARGVAVREFPLKTGFADYLLFVDRRAIGAIEAKAEGATLAAVEAQSAKYSVGLPDIPPAWRKPLPFLYESTGVETFFTNGLDPEPRSRRVFAFHKPETLAHWASDSSSLCARLRQLPTLITTGLWDGRIEAITNLEQSFAADRPRALIQMATGSGKNLHRRQFHLSHYRICERAPRAVPRGSHEPRQAGTQGISAVRHARRWSRVHRTVQCPTPRVEHARPREPRLHHDDSALVLDVERRDGIRRGIGRAIVV